MKEQNYFAALEQEFGRAYDIASRARKEGFDPKERVEITVAPDIAGRVEGLIGIAGVAKLISERMAGRTRNELAFEVTKEICNNSAFDSYETIKRILIAVRVGLAIMTEGVLVAPTEGIQNIEHYKNADNSDYIAVLYAGPIRSAGGTAVALSAALADYSRRFFGIGSYKATQEEVERYIEEVELYHAKIARLQYMPSNNDMRAVIENCGVCVDGVPTEELQVSAHANILRRGFDGKEVRMNNRIRGGVPLVLSSTVQKAKSVLRETKKFGLDWSWLDNVIKVEKKESLSDETEDNALLEELVAGRPILAYPKHFGGFRLRYGRSRLTGIAAKGFSPATMITLDNFIGIGTQLKIELPGKGCVAMPVDSIEGPFVRLRSGERLRINSADDALRLKGEVASIIAVGDILITYGDFRKSNTQLQPSSYVEELWHAQLEKACPGTVADDKKLTFKEAYELSKKYEIPIHPKFLFEFQAVTVPELCALAKKICGVHGLDGKDLFGIESLSLQSDKETELVLDRMMVPRRTLTDRTEVRGDFAQGLLASLGFLQDMKCNLELGVERIEKEKEARKEALELVNALAQFQIPRRSTFIGARIGRPEKARERLMKPAPNSIFPIGSYGGKGRNITGAFESEARKFARQKVRVEIARYRCDTCKRLVASPYCYDCGRPTKVERICKKCGVIEQEKLCRVCGSETIAYEETEMDLERMIDGAMKRLRMAKLPAMIKGVKGLINKDKAAEPVEKGILRAYNQVFTFKDGTSRFDATDAPITHFYPREMNVSVDMLRSLGYTTDYLGNDLASDDQLVELRHQDVMINKRGAEYFLKVAKFVDDLLERFYGLEPFYNTKSANDLIGKLVITLSPHTSCAVLNRIVGFTDASVGFAHPYTISARRRNADGDEDTMILLLDALLNFSREYLPVTIGGTMDAPLLLTTKVIPEEIDDEAHAMEVVKSYPVEFYEKTFAGASPGEVKMELVENRLHSAAVFENLNFTHLSSINAISSAPKRSQYTQLKTMQEKIDAEFELMDKLESIERKDAAKRLIMSHFIPDLMGNLHSFSKQRFRCSSCNAKYRRVPLTGTCTRDNGKLLLTISKGSIEKYLVTAINLANRYDLDTYTKQRLALIKDEIASVFGTAEEVNANAGQFDLSKFI